MNFNSGGRFNQDAGHNGFFWNGMEYKMIVNVRELLTTHESLTEQLANLIFSENIKAVYDSILQTAFYDESDQFSSDDEFTVSILCQLMDSFGMKDEFAELIVLAFLNEQVKLIEDAMNFGAMLDSNEDINLEDISDIKALFDVLDKFEMTELEAALRIMFYLHDSFEATDSDPEPKLAETDWLIGNWGSPNQSWNSRLAQIAPNNYTSSHIDFINGGDDNFNNPRKYGSTTKLDPAYDWLLPFSLKVDWNNTTIQVSPTAENVSIEVPGVDGSMIVDTVYKDRLFEIVGFSEQNLTVQEKEDLKRKIANILASTKNQSKKLTIQSREISFDVRYSGDLEILESNSWIRAKIPLIASVYGYSQFEETVYGSGNIKNDGSVAIGVRNVIKGPCTNPSFTMGAENYSWNGDILQGSYLTIDHDMKSVWITDSTGKKTNQLAKFSGNFQKIPPETSIAIVADQSIEQSLITQWKNKMLW